MRLKLVLLAVAALAASAALADGVRIRMPSPADLEGDWVSERFLEGVRESRSPVGAPEPLAFTVERHGAGFRLRATNFHEAFWRSLGGVEAGPGRSHLLVLGPPEAEPQSADDFTRRAVEVTWAARAPETLTGDLWGAGGERTTYRRLTGPLLPHLTRLVLAGAYRDEDGEAYVLTETGEARWPGETFRFEMNLDASEAGCDYLSRPDPAEPGGRKRYGFEWRDGTLRLFHVVYDRDAPISPASRPFALLTPEAAWRPAGGRGRGVALSPLPIVARNDGSFEALVGGGARVEIHFREPGAKRMPEVLTDPPATVRRLDARSSCLVDGGNWAPGNVWLSRDESVLGLLAFSGSGARLELYETTGCSLLGSVEAAGTRLDVNGDRIVFHGGCEWEDDTHGTCVPATVHLLDDDGVPRKRTDESRELTRTIFGIAFDVRTDLEFPGGGYPREREGRTPYAEAPRVLGFRPN